MAQANSPTQSVSDKHSLSGSSKSHAHDLPPEQMIGQVPKNLKDSGSAQFLYGRASAKAAEIYDPSSHRLEDGNPDIGDVDLGTIQASEAADGEVLLDDDDALDIDTQDELSVL
jgi:hypothetical protein